ncbi:MAG: heat shock protein transcriptional repressor HspR [bacterium JZ-2024 1]
MPRIDLDEDTPVYTIGVVAEMLGVHPQTLRVYEREGLVKPRRSQRNSRLFSRKDIERIRLILSLTQDLGVNLAGVEIILRLLKEREEFNKRFREFVKKMRERWGEEVPEPPWIPEETALVPVEPTAIARRSRVTPPPPQTQKRKKR